MKSVLDHSILTFPFVGRTYTDVRPKGTHSKIDPLLDDMLRNYPKVEMGRAEKTAGVKPNVPTTRSSGPTGRTIGQGRATLWRAPIKGVSAGPRAQQGESHATNADTWTYWQDRSEAGCRSVAGRSERGGLGMA